MMCYIAMDYTIILFECTFSILQKHDAEFLLKSCELISHSNRYSTLYIGDVILQRFNQGRNLSHSVVSVHQNPFYLYNIVQLLIFIRES